MSYLVGTNHKIEAYGADLMQLLDSDTGEVIVTAQRENDEWTISADGITDVTSPTRPDAIQAMVTHALQLLPGKGYSTTVPYGLSELP